MDEPTHEELADPAFRRHFAAAYRGPHEAEDVLTWLHTPQHPDHDGQPSPTTLLRQRTEAAFRRDATPDAVQALRHAQEHHQQDQLHLHEATRTARQRAEQQRHEHPNRPEPRSRTRRGLPTAAGAAAVAAAALGYLLGLNTQPGPPVQAAPPPSAQQQIKDKVADSAGDLVAQDYYRLYPDDLPLDWGAATTGTSYRQLRGHQTLELTISPESRSLLIFVTCTRTSGRFHWHLSGTRSNDPDSHDGACGQLTGQQVPLTAQQHGALALTVEVDRTETASSLRRYGVTVLER